jgi:pimeloyl-ACP methyl ester carboxylesterase
VASATGSAALATGVTMPYVEQGDPSGVPLLLLHGYTDSWRFFEPLLGHLPESVHAYAVTQRGHGDAGRPPDGYRPQHFAADAVAFMDAVGLDAAVVAGQSSGGVVAQRLAVDHPGRTLGLALVGTPRDFRGLPGVVAMSRTIAELTDPIDPGFVREFVQSTITQPVPPDYLDTLVAESGKVLAYVWKATLRGLLEAEIASASATITAPTLILWGDQDMLCSRADQEAMAADIPGAELVAYAGTGHSVAAEQPARTAADITAFLQRVRRTALAPGA